MIPVMETKTPLIYEKQGAISRIRFNRPEALNALDVETTAAFLNACRSIAADKEVRVIVLSGEGRAFVAGGDLAKIRISPTTVVGEMIGHMHEGLKILAELPAPVVGSVHGAVAGGGLSLALSCDLLIAAEGTRFSFAYSNVGASCDLSGSWNLVRQVGLKRSMGIALLGETFDAQEALQLGIVNRVVPACDLPAETEKILAKLVTGPTVAFGYLKKLMRNSLECDLATQLDAERDSFLACTQTHDFLEALEAFAQKRAPKFEGR